MYQDLPSKSTLTKANTVKLTKKNPPMIRSRGNGRRPACHSIGDGYVQGRTSGKNSDEQSLTSQEDFGWALWKTQKTATFSQKAENYLLDVC